MNRRETIAALAAIGAIAPLCAFAQKQEGIRRVAYLGTVSATADEPRLAEFRKTMRGFGYVEGQNLVIDFRYAGGDTARVPALAWN